jgi:hypothetical protein
MGTALTTLVTDASDVGLVWYQNQYFNFPVFTRTKIINNIATCSIMDFAEGAPMDTISIYTLCSVSSATLMMKNSFKYNIHNAINTTKGLMSQS